MAQNETFTLDFKFGGNIEFLAKLETLMQRVDDRFDVIEDSFEETTDSLRDFGSAVKDISPSIDSFGNKIGGLAERFKYLIASYVSLYSIQRIWGFGMESMNIASVQNQGEMQLRNVLKNTGNEGSYEELKATASAIQGKTNYGDEAMIGAAAELSTYMKDPEALKAMMNMLADYAAGMTGGGEVGYDQMVQFATGLGMAYDGNYMSLNRKGFDTSGLKKLDKKEAAGGKVSEMDRVRALQESLETWNGLAEDMAGSGAASFIKLKNKLGDLREELGTRLFPIFNKLVAALDEKMPQIKEMLDGIGDAFESIAEVITDNIDDIIDFGKSLSEWVPKIINMAFEFGTFINRTIRFENVIKGLVGVMAVEKVSEFSGVFSKLMPMFNNNTIAIQNFENVASEILDDMWSIDGGFIGGLKKGREALNEFGNTALGKFLMIGAAFTSISMAIDAIKGEWDAKKVLESNNKKQREQENSLNRLLKDLKKFREGIISEEKYKDSYNSVSRFLGKDLKNTAFNIWKEIKKERKDVIRKPDNNTMNVNLTADIDKIGLLLNANMRRLIESQIRLNRESSIVTEVG